MRIQQLIDLLNDRLSEFEWAAKEKNFLLFPNRYPRGLFRSSTGVNPYVLSEYIDEIKKDLQTLKALSYEQALIRSDTVLKKISVLTNALNTQQKNKPNLNTVDRLLHNALSANKNAFQYIKEESEQSSHENKNRMKADLTILKKHFKTLDKILKSDGATTKDELRHQALKAEIHYLEREIKKSDLSKMK